MDDGAALGERENGQIAPVEAAASEPMSEPAARSRLPVGPTLWAAFVVALALYLLFGRATIENGILTGTPLRLTTIGGQFTELMRAWGFGAPLIAIVWAFGGVGLLLSVAAVWFALAARDDPDATA
ncbi:MAG TPA: hypothetical protein VFI22_07115 [Thermomicrobiales bacterium]|nr:hypothetical protein [Thermomicrobiales bacterium]